jgi:hypothetical protein
LFKGVPALGFGTQIGLIVTTPHTPSRLVLPHTGAVGQLNGREIVRSTLPVIVPVLVSLGATQVLIPAPNSQDQHNVKAALDRMDPATRRLVKVVDKRGAIQRRVREFVSPLASCARQWPEDAFAQFSESEMYLYAVAADERASILERESGSPIVEFLPIIDASLYGAAAKLPLAALGSIATSYQPTIVTNPHLRVELSTPGVETVLERAIESSEFARATQFFGRLGYVRHPTVMLRRISRAVGDLVSSGVLRHTLAAGVATAHLTGPPGVASAAALATADQAARSLKMDESFSPPRFSLDLALELQVARSALKRSDPAARFPKGTIFAETYSSGPVHGVSWLSKGEEAKLRVSTSRWLASEGKALLAARIALPKLLASA